MPETKAEVLLNTQNAFPIYPNRSEYLAVTGEEAPPYDPSRPIKKWRDLSAGANGRPKAIYPNNVMLREDGTFYLENGVPVTEPLTLTSAEARTVNLPPEDPSGNTSIQPGTVEISCPFRDLTHEEILVVAGREWGFLSGQQIVIRNTRIWAEEQAAAIEESGLFSKEDRALLHAIAAKLGVS